MTTEILPLHKNIHHLKECVDLLNEEWPLSYSARNHMLGMSNDSFPYSLVLMESGTSKEQVIGHSRLVRVQGQKSACFVQSVVVSKQKRGQGYGKILMIKTEEHALSLGITTMYLTTHDKQHFYEHVGYQYCEPVKFSSSKVITGTIWDKTVSENSKEVSVSTQKNTSNTEGGTDINVTPNKVEACDDMTLRTTVIPSAPPPPPLAKVHQKDNLKQQVVYWMKKDLT